MMGQRRMEQHDPGEVCPTLLDYLSNHPVLYVAEIGFFRNYHMASVTERVTPHS